MFSLDLECAAIHMVPVQMQQEPLESSDDNDDKSVKALALEMCVWPLVSHCQLVANK